MNQYDHLRYKPKTKTERTGEAIGTFLAVITMPVVAAICLTIAFDWSWVAGVGIFAALATLQNHPAQKV